eukprot:CAMPEP_0168507964 /NCGR_PEP_ID=MMETSP0228-20121227/78142_1 /TAXON_ID=133427 /ORGANISM="Protoceratium reticulatum, Strain CCCM 535 (=CCMP 1889)" /LENGTH=329 /DNA_ID=CAMNT_0008525067 /DNA_START=119 /DNA_END=1103 /DNA_ORIENTATION=-
MALTPSRSAATLLASSSSRALSLAMSMGHMSQNLDLLDRERLRKPHARHEDLQNVAELARVASCGALDSPQGGVDLPYIVQLTDARGPREKGVEQLPQKVVVCLAGGMHAVLEDADEAALDALPDKGPVGIAREVSVTIPCDLVLCHDLGNTILGPEVLIFRADNVHRGHFQLAADEAGLRSWSEVAILDAEGVDEAAADHLAVALVVEAGNRHAALRCASKEEAMRLDPQRQPLDDEMQLAVPELEAELVELPVAFGVPEHTVRRRGVGVLALGARGIEQVVRPVVDIVARALQRLQILVPQLAHGRALRVRKAVRGDDEDPHTANHA